MLRDMPILLIYRLVVHVKKGKSKFSEPLKVTQQKGPHSYTLTDGKTWDVSHLSVLLGTFTLPIEEHRPMESATSDSVQSRSQQNTKQLGSQTISLENKRGTY